MTLRRPQDRDGRRRIRGRDVTDTGTSRLLIRLAVAAALAGSSVSRAILVVNDPLEGSTTGTRSGGTFLPQGGWQVNSHLNYIFWHVAPTITHGAYEFDVRGVGQSCSGGYSKNELSHMYDWTYQNADYNYIGYRNNPYKHFVRKQCRIDRPNEHLEILWGISPNFFEDDAGHNLNWDPLHTYHFRVEWVPNGQGGTAVRTLRDGSEVHSRTVPGIWSPAGHSVRIASSLRGEEGAYIGAVYSSFKVWDLDRLPPEIEPVMPNPQKALVGRPYTQQLVLLEGTPQTTWAMVSGPAGLQVNDAGLVHGWTPGHDDARPEPHPIKVRAANAYGQAIAAWEVHVVYRADLDRDRDVDQSDFGLFQTCATGSGVRYVDGCEDADLDGDGDVDIGDFTGFRECMSGPGSPPEC